MRDLTELELDQATGGLTDEQVRDLINLINEIRNRAPEPTGPYGPVIL
jgi:hypothetical protein